MLLHLESELVEFVLQVLFITHYFLVLFSQLSELLLQFNHLLSDSNEFALVVFPAHFVLLELPEQRSQLIPLEPVFLQRVLELIV